MKKKVIALTVTAAPSYLPSLSAPEHQKFVWSYEMTIVNESEEIVQLLNRFWRIADLTGKVDEIYGVGVVGLQPLIKPGKSFVYKSFCQLTTPQGAMEGYYELQTLADAQFKISIPKFILTAPASITKGYRSLLH